MTIINDTNAVYSLVGAPGAGTNVAGGANVTFDVQFAPGATAQVSTAQLEIQNTGPIATVTTDISGEAQAVPQADVTPTGTITASPT